MKKVVITGATGAIGRALITVCIKEGYEVLAVVHRNSKRASELEKIEHCKVLYLDFSEYANLAQWGKSRMSLNRRLTA